MPPFDAPPLDAPEAPAVDAPPPPALPPSPAGCGIEPGVGGTMLPGPGGDGLEDPVEGPEGSGSSPPTVVPEGLLPCGAPLPDGSALAVAPPSVSLESALSELEQAQTTETADQSARRRVRYIRLRGAFADRDRATISRKTHGLRSETNLAAQLQPVKSRDAPPHPRQRAPMRRTSTHSGGPAPKTQPTHAAQWVEGASGKAASTSGC